jgi:branched-chain amino acid transport system ATP-binding protein
MGLLDVENLYTGYEGGDVLHGVTLAVDEGTVVTLLGRNGVGKTTTLRAIIDMLSPRSGTIQFADEDITELRPHETYERGICLVPEDRRIFPDLTVEENLRVPLVDQGTDRSIETIYDFFPKLQELKASKGKNLSGGEQQMLAIGRALRQNPRLLLLDEPSEGLAPQIIEDVAAAVEEIAAQGTTILLVEQNVQFAFDVSSYGYIMEDGEIVLDGSIDDLLQEDQNIEQYLGIHATS